MGKFFKKIYSFAYYRVAAGEVMTVLYSLCLHVHYSFREKKPGKDKETLEYFLVKHCHIVEKGLALPAPRKGFGQPKIEMLIKRTHQYEKKYGESQVGLMVRDTLREYLLFHKDDLNIFTSAYLESLRNFVSEKPRKEKGGLKHIIKSDMTTFGAEVFESFLKCRHSVRNFSDVPVDDGVIMKAISISQNTPSVCNRQGWFVHYYNEKNKIRELLSFQNGNSGFTDSVDKLLIITCSVKAFTQHEHNQLFIDGGLYSMNLILSLHSVGLGCCPLNTCMPWVKAKKMKEAAGIKRYERVIMMLAVGNLLDEFSVAQSEKYPFRKIMRIH